MADLRELYQEILLDHNRRPRNFGALPAANRRAEGHNPLCGDQVTLFLEVADGAIRDLAFQGSGCAISTASASMMTTALKGRTIEEARALFRGFQALVTTGEGPEGGAAPDLGELAVLGGVREYPMRVKCATLPWHTLKAALERPDEAERPVSTEGS